MTRDQIIEAGAKIIDPEAWIGMDPKTNPTRSATGLNYKRQQVSLEKAAAMLDVITKDAGLKLVGMPEGKDTDSWIVARWFSAAPWVPEDRTPTGADKFVAEMEAAVAAHPQRKGHYK